MKENLRTLRANEKDLKDNLSLVARKIIEDFPQILPDAMVYPDTSARPLASAMQPIFQRVAQERGVKSPNHYFFSTPDAEFRMASILLGRCADDGITIDEYIKRNDQGSALGKRVQHIQSLMDQRAAEIIFYLQQSRPNSEHSVELIIVDDLATIFGHTIAAIRRAFHSQSASQIVRPLKGYVLGTKPRQALLQDPTIFSASYQGSVGVPGVKKSDISAYSMPIRSTRVRNDTRATRLLMREFGEEIANAMI